MKHRRLIMSILIVLLPLLFSGCWDKYEIERKIFVSTIGIDVGEDIDKEQKIKNENKENQYGDKNIKKLKVTYGFPDISHFSPSQAVIDKDGTITVSTYSMQGAFAEANNKSSRTVYLGHARLILISKEIFKYPDTFREVVDYIRRQPNLNRKIYIVLTDGAVEQFMNAQFDIDKHIQTYISGILENNQGSESAVEISLNDFLTSVGEKNNAVLPILKMDRDNKEIKLSGIGVMDNYEFKGQLNDAETTTVEVLRGKAKKVVKVVNIDGHPYDYEIDRVKRKIEVNENNGEVEINIRLKLSGAIKEGYKERPLTLEEIKDLESIFNKTISEECIKVMKSIQQNIGIDIVGIDDYIRKFKPSIWEKFGEDWSEIYSNSNITIEVETDIKTMGIIK
ncbi:MAG: Ger(x)C family spore germination protein [Clostridium sp.]|uniref:Ger(x)C family spore germination protein n=1 Tax=Clostridium sp. TaxID=1506 RepID=UPI002A89B6BA|nr:Ger(x)C family spore germination protein [Clostridium sp.]MDY5099601.1 Ger(x)C family spore germination protein [Clostridium sp.]